jgi:hypothetical protein
VGYIKLSMVASAVLRLASRAGDPALARGVIGENRGREGSDGLRPAAPLASGATAVETFSDPSGAFKRVFLISSNFDSRLGSAAEEARKSGLGRDAKAACKTSRGAGLISSH